MLLFALGAALSCAAPVPGERPADPIDVSFQGARISAIEAAFAARTTALSTEEIRDTARAIDTAAARHGVEPELILAVIHIESGYFNFARSHVGALGLMQLMPATGRMLARESGVAWSGPEDLFDPALNVALGTRYLAELRDRYGDWDHALAAYNWGPGAIDRRLARGDGLPSRYRRQVLARLTSGPSTTGAAAVSVSAGGGGAPATPRTKASMASSTEVR
jgi:soluble lytic murein transglycosylase-like protein